MLTDAQRKELYPSDDIYMMRYLLSDRDYKKLEKMEELCLDLTNYPYAYGYFEVARECDAIIFGPTPRGVNPDDFKTALYRIYTYLVRRAGELRGVKFAE